ncbi:MAG: hypothetical protein QXG39_00310 [Candidatus Aenigmatarchaeota archaeon]
MENEVIQVLQKFKEMNPWKGTVGERIDKFKWLFKEMKRIYNLNDWQLICAVPTEIKNWYSSGSSYCDKLRKVIVLRGRLSVITFLHEFAHALGMSQGEARVWSESLFKKVFPEKWENLVRDSSGLMVRK